MMAGKSLESLQHAWQIVAENQIRTAQAEGKFNDLPGFGHPLEQLIDIRDPNGWIRRAAGEVRAVHHPDDRKTLAKINA